MAEQDDDAEREHEPSQRRLDEARKRGDVPRSADLTTAAVYGGLLLAILVTGKYAMDMSASAGMTLLSQADRLAPSFMQAGRARTLEVLASIALPLSPFLLLPLLAALISLVGQRGLVFSGEKIEPKLSRISPLASLAQKFGRQGLFEFAKSLVKLIVVCALLAIIVPQHADELLLSMRMEPAQSTLLLWSILQQFLILAFLAAVVFGGADYGWQWLQHRRRNMMTRQEMVDEHKESDGDPHLKMQRRQKGREFALNQMLQDVAKADVVLVNPTHYAVALKWKRGDRTAPILLAKGVDDVAARIREKAAELGIPIHRDPPTARAIHATVEIGAPIRPEHFKAVAAAIRFAEAMRKKAKAMRK